MVFSLLSPMVTMINGVKVETDKRSIKKEKKQKVPNGFQSKV
jgi:hypothetical protein